MAVSSGTTHCQSHLQSLVVYRYTSTTLIGKLRNPVYGINTILYTPTNLITYSNVSRLERLILLTLTWVLLTTWPPFPR